MAYHKNDIGNSDKHLRDLSVLENVLQGSIQGSTPTTRVCICICKCQKEYSPDQTNDPVKTYQEVCQSCHSI